MMATECKERRHGRSVLLGVVASLLSMPGIAQMSDAPSLAGVIDLHAHVAPETAALNYKRCVDPIEAARIAREYGMQGLVFMEHTTETASWAYLVPGSSRASSSSAASC